MDQGKKTIACGARTMDGSVYIRLWMAASRRTPDMMLGSSVREQSRSIHMTSHHSMNRNMRLVTDAPHNGIAEDIWMVDEALDAGMRAQCVVALHGIRIL
jgi:hypothetical protein